MTALGADLRYGVRLLRRNPGFTATIVATLALGIGANSAVFSLVNAVLLRPLPYNAANRIYDLHGRTKLGTQWISAPDFLTWRERTRTFDSMTAARYERYVITGAQGAEEVNGLAADSRLMPLLGVAALAGRTFTADDYRDGAPPTAVIGYKLWKRRYAADRRVLGTSILLNGAPHLLVGVMPADFQFPSPLTEVWTPMAFSARALSQRDWPAFQVWARARPGATRTQAEQEARLMSAAISREYPEVDRSEGWRLMAERFEEEEMRHASSVLLVLLGAVGFVLLIACLNIASMLLSRESERSKEMAIRASLGAGRLRLIRQTLVESILLSGLGGALGLAVAAWGMRALLAAYPDQIPMPRAEQAHLDVTVLGFTLALSVVCGALFGTAPAMAAWRVNLIEGLKEGGRGMARAGKLRSRSALIVVEIALSLVLLAGAGLMIQSVARLIRVSPGFNQKGVLTMRLPMPTYLVPDRKKQPLYYQRILEQVQATPGVRAAALVSALPLSGWQVNLGLSKPLVTKSGERREVISYRAVTPEYFRVLGIPVLAGRAFENRDTAQAPLVAIVSQAMAREFWGDENPVGRVLDLDPKRTVVGIAGNVRHLSLSKDGGSELYMPLLQGVSVGQSALVVRTAGDPAGMLAEVERQIRRASADQPIQEPRTLEQVVSRSISEPRFYMVLLSVFAGLALALAAAGVYGVMSFSVSRREHEFGVRMAMGASPGEVLKLVLSRGALYAMAGIVLGLGGALAATRLISNVLFGVHSADALTHAVVAALLLFVAIAACYVPARRAAKVDPMSALRQD